MNEVRFRIAVSAQEYLRYYKQEVDTILVSTADGRTIQLPAGTLLKFVDQSGIHGSFRVIYDDNNKLVRIERVSN